MNPQACMYTVYTVHSPFGIGLALFSAACPPGLGKNFSNPFGIFWLSAVHPRIKEPRVSGADCRLSRCMARCICTITIIKHHGSIDQVKKKKGASHLCSEIFLKTKSKTYCRGREQHTLYQCCTSLKSTVINIMLSVSCS